MQYVHSKAYMTQEQFVQLSTKQFSATIKFDSKTLWLNKTIQADVKRILDHNYSKLRVRYKLSHSNNNLATIWFLEEIGKERPISFAICINNNQVQMVRVLEFRESRGYEIQIPAFTQQFEQIKLNTEGKLDRNIDGITGATMSVNAMKKITRVALLFHNIVSNKLKLAQSSKEEIE